MQGRGAQDTAINLLIAFGIWGCSGVGPLLLAQNTGIVASAGRRITIDVRVTDKSGRAISDLKAADFKVFDNKHEEKILDFTATDASHPSVAPPHIQIVLDAMNSGPDTVAQERDGVNAFLSQDSAKLDYAMSIWALENEGLKQIAPPSKDGTALLAALNEAKIPLRVINQSGGIWGDVERTNQAIELVKKIIAIDSTTRGRKLVLFLSPGWPMLLNFEPDHRNWLFDEIVDISNGLRESDTAFYALAPSVFNASNSSYLSYDVFNASNSSYFAYEHFLKGVTRFSDAQNADLCLQVLAEHSGGLVMAEGNDIKTEINAAVRDAGAYYTLSFERASNHGRTEYHAIRVTVDKQRMKVRTTAGYYIKGP